MTRELIMLGAIAGTMAALVAAGPLDDPSSGPAGGTTNVRPALPSTITDGSQRLSRPAPRNAAPIQPSPLESTIRPDNRHVRDIVVPGAQRTLPAPAGFVPREGTERVTVTSPYYHNTFTETRSVDAECFRCHTSDGGATGSLSDRFRVNPRLARDGLLGPNSRAIDMSRVRLIPGADPKAPGIRVFENGMVVTRPLGLMDYIRYSGAGPYWSERVNSGSDAAYPTLQVNKDGSVTATYPRPSTNWYNTPTNPLGDGWNNSVVSDPQYPIPANGILLAPVSAPPLTIVPEAAPSMLDQADAKFAARDYAGAALLYQQHVAAAPDDGWALRAMAISLFLSNRLNDGALAMARAYSIMPELADQPMPAAAFPRGAAEVRDAVGRASAFAEKARTDEAWLMAAVLLQSSGQPKGALKMVDRAAAAGLDPVVAAKMNAALAKP